MPYCTDPMHCRHCNTWNDCQACLHAEIDYWVDSILTLWTLFEIRDRRESGGK